MDKSLPQLRPLFTINNTDKYHIRRNSIDYQISGDVLKKSTNPYYEMVGLLSQFAPQTITSGTLHVAATYTLTTYVAGDDFSNMELISGTVNTTGSVFRATVDTPIDYSNGSTLDYDGAPFFYSLFYNDFPVQLSFQYINDGSYRLNINYDASKITLRIGLYNDQGSTEPMFIRYPNVGGTSFYVYTFYHDPGNPNVFADGLLNKSPFRMVGFY